MTISVILMLRGLLGLLGFAWCQCDISCAVITLRVTFSPDLIVIPFHGVISAVCW